MATISILLANHVEVRLQHDTGSILTTGARRLADIQIARCIDDSRQTARQGPLQQEITQPGLHFRSPRRRAQRCKMRPDGRWLKAQKHRVSHVTELQK